MQKIHFQKSKTILFVLLILLSFFSFVQTPIIKQAFAATETRYMYYEGWESGLYNLSTASGGASYRSTTMNISAEEEPVTIYHGIKVYVIKTDNTRTLVSGGIVAIASVTRGSTGDYSCSATWVHSQIDQAGMGVEVEVWADIQNPPTTLRHYYRTENYTAPFDYISAGTWTVYYYGYSQTALTKTTCNFRWGSTTYNTRITNYAVGNLAYPLYSNVGTDRVYPFGNVNCTFHSNWTSPTSNLSHYIFSHDNANGTWVNQTYAFSGAVTSASANVSWCMSASGDCTVYWRYYANNSAGLWNSTGIQVTYIWKKVPPIGDADFGQISTPARDGIYFNGSKEAIFVAFMNTSYSPVRYQIKAFDIAYSLWTETVDTGDNAEGTDSHYAPCISILPNGSLIVMFGYYQPLYYRVSINSASAESNLTKLISEWNSLCQKDNLMCYATPLRWDDRLIVFCRNGTSLDGRESYYTWDSEDTDFDAAVDFIAPPSGNYSIYSAYGKSGDNILCAFTGYDSEDKHIYFLYSPNQGSNWYLIDGTSLTTPIEADDCFILASAHRTRVYTPILDENDSVCMATWQMPETYDTGNGVGADRKCRIAYYSGTLNSSGTWTLMDMTDDDGDKLYGMITGGLIFDSFYGRPCLYASGNQSGYYLTKYVRAPNSTSVFVNVTVMETSHKIWCEYGLVRDTRIDYDMISWEVWLDVLGNTTIGSAKHNMTDAAVTAWGCKFTASTTCYLNGVDIYANCMESTSNWKFALYNEDLTLNNNIGSNYLTTGSAGYGWLCALSFLTPPLVYADTSYWLCFQIQHNSTTEYYYSASNAVVNQTLSFSLDFISAFPSSITSPTYYNRTITILAYPCYMAIRGLGNYPTGYTNIGANSTVGATVCQFHVYASSMNVLSFGNFRHNNTGAWSNSSFLALSGSASWVNFTETLNWTEYRPVVVVWEVWTNDTNGKWSSTETQNLTFTAFNIVFQTVEVLQVSDSSLNLKEKLQQPITTATLSITVISLKEKLLNHYGILSTYSLGLIGKEKALTLSDLLNLAFIHVILKEKSIFPCDTLHLIDAMLKSSEVSVTVMEITLPENVTITSYILINKEKGLILVLQISEAFTQIIAKEKSMIQALIIYLNYLAEISKELMQNIIIRMETMQLHSAPLILKEKLLAPQETTSLYYDMSTPPYTIIIEVIAWGLMLALVMVACIVTGVTVWAMQGGKED